MSEHGTTSRYTGGCRCARCRRANAGYQRAYQARRKASAPLPAFTIKRDVAHPPESFVDLTCASVTYVLRPIEPAPLDALVAACVNLREAFAAYHQAHTQEPAT